MSEGFRRDLELAPGPEFRLRRRPVARLVSVLLVLAALATEQTINELLGKDVSARFRFIMERAREVKELDV